VVENLSLVKAVASRIRESLPPHVELDDLTHAGILGLIAAAGKFDPDRQVSFAAYAKHRIRGAILDSLRALGWASRDLRRRQKQLEAATRDLTAELHRNPTEDEVAARLGLDDECWRHLMSQVRSLGPISADSRATEYEDLPAAEYAGPADTKPDNMCRREQMRVMVGRAMTVLSDRYRQVVTMYYVNGMTMKEIGAELGVNESRVSQIHAVALEKMNSALQRAGVQSAGAF
jgi:RNA polymerase sigma factor for flagellar operon FliA